MSYGQTPTSILANLQEDTILSLRWGLYVDGGLHDSRR